MIFGVPIIKHFRVYSGSPFSAILTMKASKLKIIKFANSTNSDEMTHNDEPPNLYLHCLPSSP